jgi:hypothetical protein
MYLGILTALIEVGLRNSSIFSYLKFSKFFRPKNRIFLRYKGGFELDYIGLPVVVARWSSLLHPEQILVGLNPCQVIQVIEQ